MIRIYLDELLQYQLKNNTKEIIRDVEEAFDGLRGTEFEKIAIHRITKGEYIDKNFWRTQFGEVLPVSKLSTGVKAAVVIQNNPDKIVDCAECLPVARDTILMYLHEGNAIIYDDQLTICDVGEEHIKIDVAIDDCRFHTASSLSDYMYDGAWLRDRDKIVSDEITWEETNERFYY